MARALVNKNVNLSIENQMALFRKYSSDTLIAELKEALQTVAEVAYEEGGREADEHKSSTWENKATPENISLDPDTKITFKII